MLIYYKFVIVFFVETYSTSTVPAKSIFILMLPVNQFSVNLVGFSYMATYSHF